MGLARFSFASLIYGCHLLIHISSCSVMGSTANTVHYVVENSSNINQERVYVMIFFVASQLSVKNRGSLKTLL